MADTADVRSIEAIQEVRNAFCAFDEEVRNALMDVDFDIRRAREWLTNEQRLYWNAEIRRWEQNLAMAKGELMRKRLGRFLDRKPDTSQEEKAVQFAERRLEECHQKREITRRWATEFLRHMQEYHSQVQPLLDWLDQDVVRAIARLDRMVAAIEAYTQVAPPPRPDAGNGTEAATTMARPAALGPTNNDVEATADSPEPDEPFPSDRDEEATPP
jgi:hypothetical protein